MAGVQRTIIGSYNEITELIGQTFRIVITTRKAKEVLVGKIVKVYPYMFEAEIKQEDGSISKKTFEYSRYVTGDVALETMDKEI